MQSEELYCGNACESPAKKKSVNFHGVDLSPLPNGVWNICSRPGEKLKFHDFFYEFCFKNSYLHMKNLYSHIDAFECANPINESTK